MKSIEKYLSSGYYIATIFIITYIAWRFNESTPPYDFNLYNMIGMFVLVISMTLILTFYKNALYITPIIAAILFIVSKHDLTFETATTIGFPHIAFAIFLTGPIIHYFRFKPTFKKGSLLLGLSLIALAYVIPLLYTPFDITAIPVSFVALVYLLLYIAFTSTIEGNIDYLMKMMLGVTLLLSAQMFTVITRGMIAYNDLPFYEAFYQGVSRSWYKNFGWGNINDVAFYIALTFPSITYFIFKRPKNIVYWILLFIPIIAVVLSGSRGGVIGFGFSAAAVIFIIFRYRSELITKNGLLVITLFLVLFAVNYRIFEQVWLAFYDSWDNDLNAFSSGRLDIYREGLKIFRQYPLFGAGWLSIYWFDFGGRIFMFHSTFIHVLATMGLFGLFALMVHYKEVFTVFLKDATLEKKLIMVGYIATQIHGLIDNVQFSVPFSVWIVMVFAMIETAPKSTVFKRVKYVYHPNYINK
ncbi:MAG: O-antigen ligase family protein [Acholeplasmataceae bacterium]